MKALITVGCITDHGGIISTGDSSYLVEGKAVHLDGMTHFCPKCKVQARTIASNQGFMMVGGKSIVAVGDQATCGAKYLKISDLAVMDRGFTTKGANFFNLIKPQNTEQYAKETLISTKNAINLVDIEDGVFIPLAVPSFDNKLTKEEFIFLIKSKHGNFDTIALEVMDEGRFVEIRKVVTLLGAGEKIKIAWDGFINEIYKSKLFLKSNGVRFKVKGFNGGHLVSEDEKVFNFEYANKDWMDVVIGRKTKNIHINLRVNFQDGGDVGLASGNRVPKSKINSQKPSIQPLNKRSKSFKELKELAIQGMDFYWSRNKNHLTGKSIQINSQEYQVIVKTIESSSNSMPILPIIFSTNWKPGRSCNWELSRKIYYNIGYTEFSQFSGNPNDSIWEYWNESIANKKFKHTFAHEMGHEILLAYGGQAYSKMHKGTSTLISQAPLDGTTYPRSGEIDLMKYANENPSNPSIKSFFERSVASNEDVASLLFLSGIRKK